MSRTAPSDRDIESLTTEFTNQLTAIIKRAALEKVLAALGGDGSTKVAASVSVPGRKRGRPAGSKNKPKPKPKVRGKRTTEAVAQMGERLLAYVKAQPGRRADQIAKVFHTDVKTIRLPMQRLIAMKKISTKGQRRGMTYFAGGGAPRAQGGKKTSKKRGKKTSSKRTRRTRRPAKSIRRAKPRAHAPKRDQPKSVVMTPRPKPTPAIEKPKMMSAPQPKPVAKPMPQPMVAV